MSVLSLRGGKNISQTALMLLGGLCWIPAGGATLDIEAVFTADSAAPQKNEFVNKTPSRGFCELLPKVCRQEGVFSLRAPIEFVASAPVRAHHADPRQGGMAKVPSAWRDVTVTHSSGETRVVKVRIAGIAHDARIPVSIEELTGQGGIRGWDSLWQGGGWANAPAPCQGIGPYTITSTHSYRSYWKVPVAAGMCSKQALFDIPMSFQYRDIEFGYQLITPDPLSMQSGKYHGSITFSVGPGQDFDMGDVMQPSDPLLTLNFALDVQHTLKVDIPPGGERLELVPAGGWQSWLQAGRKPVRLFRDQTFHISASSRFKMYYECEAWVTFDCTIKDAVGRRQVELQVGVSLPGGLTDLSGQPVKHQRLRAGPENAQVFQPGFYVDRAPGVLHFEVSKDEVDWMLSSNVQSPYSGRVTVIWDSEV
ncbi:hypothetical protein [Pseudomonas sp. B21-048]|uniref:hypothetical protein n=1 Tax=Pseudomonas sp. B21-048 TaxID=2895490 RepID=UPI0021600A82|nr:hypothetical protein [Pseudomonas sp. B21-048]UVK97772.1 hypothetical protein LOY56_20915 [Pseudomonas sp. B21-048]